jgi:NAD(P)-dependent dehydrogenase (short-subunit alcohol dehydrogenase family)
MFDVNVHGAFWFIQACLPEMIERQSGSICLINSVLGLKGYKYDSAYAASKHAQIGMARSLAMEYAKHGITVVPICPSFVDTDMTRETIDGLARHRKIAREKAREIVANANPQRRIIPAEEVAELVAFVLANRVPSLNGNPLVMSGGD